MIPYMPLKFSVLPLSEITTASPCSSETRASLCRHTARSIAFEGDLLSRGRELSAGTEAAAALLCAVGPSQHGLFYWCGCSQNVHFPAPPGRSPAQPGEVSFSCILLSHVYNKEMLPHLKGVVGGEVHPDVGRERPESSRGSNGLCLRALLPRQLQGYLVTRFFWQISIYASARGSKRVAEESLK